MSKVYRINTKNRSVDVESLKGDYRFFGGRGLIAKFLNDEINPSCDPLGHENKLVICTGLFAGTKIPTAHRLSIGGKSPLTGGIKEANAGGTAASLLSKHGIKMIVLEDKPEDDQWTNLIINKNGTVEMVPADEYAGMNNYALTEKIHEKYGDKTGIISIGVAGEREYRNSTVQITDNSTGHPSRAAARGGLGALMGSKKIKAIIIERPAETFDIQYAEKGLFNDARKRFIDVLKKNPATGIGFAALGTAFATDLTGPSGMLPVKNFSAEIFDKLDQVESRAFITKMKENGGRTGVACQPGCTIRCSNIYNDNNGEYVTSGLEYETIALFGPNCDIADWDAIAEFDRLCDDFGIDTIETGATIGVCMEAGKISWGDTDAAMKLVREMIDGTDFGRLMGGGTLATGKALGVDRIPVAKGQAMPAYDPRNIKATGLTLATSAMGGDHTAGVSLFIEGIDHDDRDAAFDISYHAQASTALCDNMMCLFAFGSSTDTPEHFNNIVDMMSGLYGGDWNIEKLMDIGMKTLFMERDFNNRAGFTAEDDCLPEFFYKEKSPATGALFDYSHEEIRKVTDKMSHP